jgi:hypothetical protein
VILGLFVSVCTYIERIGEEDLRALDAVRRRAWARTRREATSAARRSWRMNVNRLVIAGVGCGVGWWNLEMMGYSRVVVGGDMDDRRR